MSMLPQTINVLSISKSNIIDEYFENIPINLVSLTLESCNELTGIFLSFLPTTLRKLYIISCTKLQDENLMHIPIPLVELQVSNIPGIKGLKLNLPPNLKSLNLSQTKLRNPPLAGLKYITTLTKLNLDSTLCSDILFPYLPPSLLELSMQNCNLSNEELILPPQLKTIIFRGTKISKNLICQIPESCRILDIRCNISKDNQTHIYSIDDLTQLPPLTLLKVTIPDNDYFNVSFIKKEVVVG